MPPYIGHHFNASTRRQNQFYDFELERLLCPPLFRGEKPRAHSLDMNTSLSLTIGDDKFAFAIQRSEDGKKITLDADLTKDGVHYKTEMTAVQVKDKLFEITHLVFDNKQEKLVGRCEIDSVLTHIGKEMLSVACCKKMPKPHEEKGTFGKISRFLNRHTPDNMGYWPGV